MKSLLTAFSNEARKPWPKIATNVTSARPIIKADAVDAVRAGFRDALSRARMPGAPPMCCAGQPSTFESGRTIFAAFIETPKKRSRTPIPSASNRGPVAIPLPSAPRQTRPTATSSTTSDVTGPYLAQREIGSTEPSRTAAIGGTRVARRAGRPQRRELARPLRDRDRERVRDHERADEQGHEREDEQDVLQEIEEPAEVLLVFLDLRLRVADGRGRRKQRLDLGDQRGRLNAGLRLDADVVE